MCWSLVQLTAGEEGRPPSSARGCCGGGAHVPLPIAPCGTWSRRAVQAAAARGGSAAACLSRAAPAHCLATAALPVATVTGLFRQSTAGLISSRLTRSLY